MAARTGTTSRRRSCRRGRRSRSSKPATPIRRPPTPPSTRCGSTICVRTSIARATAARAGRKITNGIPDNENVNAVREDPAAQGPAVCRHRARGLRLVRRRRSLAVVAPEHAGDLGSRPGDQGRRSRRGHARPRLLDSRRHHAAAPVGRQGRCRQCIPVRAGDSPIAFAGTPTATRRCRRTSRRAQNPPDGAIFNYYLKSTRRPGDAGDSRQLGQAGSAVLQRRSGAAARS